MMLAEMQVCDIKKRASGAFGVESVGQKVKVQRCFAGTENMHSAVREGQSAKNDRRVSFPHRARRIRQLCLTSFSSIHFHSCLLARSLRHYIYSRQRKYILFLEEAAAREQGHIDHRTGCRAS